MYWFAPFFNISLCGGDVGAANVKRLNKLKNAIVWQNVFATLLLDGLNRYKFKGLEQTAISERVLRQSLLWYGSASIFDKNGVLMALPCVPNGAGWNIYGDPAEGWLFSTIGQLNEQVDLYLPGSEESAFLEKTNGAINANAKLKGVFIRENEICYPFIRQIMFYADAIADCMRSLDVVRNNIKRPFVITAEESVVNTVKQFFKKRDANEEYIISSGIFPANSIQLLPFATNSEALKDVTALIDWYHNKYKELCGVDNNSNIDKKGENLVTREIEVGEEYTDASIDKVIKSIQSSLDNVNKLYGTNITVEPAVEHKNINKEVEGDDNTNVSGDEE